MNAVVGISGAKFKQVMEDKGLGENEDKAEHMGSCMGDREGCEASMERV